MSAEVQMGLDRAKIWYVVHPWQNKKWHRLLMISHVFFYRLGDRKYHFSLMCFPGGLRAPKHLLSYIFVNLRLWLVSLLQHFSLYLYSQENAKINPHSKSYICKLLLTLCHTALCKSSWWCLGGEETKKKSMNSVVFAWTQTDLSSGLKISWGFRHINLEGGFGHTFVFLFYVFLSNEHVSIFYWGVWSSVPEMIPPMALS